ncbi:hypothetical protein [Aeromonas phage 85AhydR10PP]|nr:hypothetical protein [Aeromonas phage 85AhydR10PP]
MKKLILIVAVSLSTLALVGCAEPTPDEAAAALEKTYLDHCRKSGQWAAVAISGGAQKYEDWALTHNAEANYLESRFDSLDPVKCGESMQAGWSKGLEYVKAGKVDMQ